MNWGSSWNNGIILNIKDVATEIFIVGQLAVKEKGWGWTVIHLPTMSSIAKAIPPGNHTKAALISWCRKVQEVCAAEWEVMNKLTPETYAEVSKEIDEVKDKLLDYCLSIKVEE